MPLVAGLLVQYLPAPTHLVYLVLFGVFLLQALGVLFMAETVARRPGALALAAPQIRVAHGSTPPIPGGDTGDRGRLVACRPRTDCSARRWCDCWSAPIVRAGRVALFVLAGSGAMAVLVLRTAAPRTMLILGIVALFTGVGITLLAISQTMAALFFVGTAVAGVGFGAGFQGALRTVLPLAGPQERAGVLSLLYVVSYLALGLPAVIAGFLVVHGGGVLLTAREYGLAVMLLAALALVAEVRPQRRSTSSQPVAPVRSMGTPVAQQPGALPVTGDQRQAAMIAAAHVCGKVAVS